MKKYKYESSAKIFETEGNIDYDGYIKASNTPILLKDILERKWTSIARLKKQVMELEKQVKQLSETNEQHQIDIKEMEAEYRENGGVIKPRDNKGELGKLASDQ